MTYKDTLMWDAEKQFAPGIDVRTDSTEENVHICISCDATLKDLPFKESLKLYRSVIKKATTYITYADGYYETFENGNSSHKKSLIRKLGLLVIDTN